MNFKNSDSVGKSNNTDAVYYFEVDDASAQLVGVICERQPLATLESLVNRIKEEGYFNFYFPPRSKEQFLKRLQSGDVGHFGLGEKRDAKIKITVSPERDSARVQTSIAWGGKRLSISVIEGEIKKAKIDQRTIDKNKLARLVKSHSEVDFILAKSIPVINGTNAYFTPLIKSKIKSKQDTDTEGAINQYEVFEFVVVVPGQPLMRMTPETTGQDGIDVTGKKIKAKAGKKGVFSKPYSGVELSPDDENLLVASIKGHPLVYKTGVKVDPVMVLNAVDIHSGNVDYDGSVFVKNDINSGFTVKITGDVLVKGAIHKANVNVGGSITVNGGVQADDHDGEYGCHLTAGGDVRAKFINHSNIVSLGNVYVAEYIMQSCVKAKGSINAGQERGKGRIIGGHCSSDTGINAKVLGSEAYVRTILSVGSESDLHRKVIKLERTLSRRCHEEQQLSTILEEIRCSEAPTKIGHVTLDKQRKIENTIILLKRKIDEISDQLNQLQSQVNASDNLHVSVAGPIFPNVLVSINDLSWSCEIMRTRVVLKLSDDVVVVESNNNCF